MKFFTRLFTLIKNFNILLFLLSLLLLLEGSGPAERRAEIQEGANMVLRAKEGFNTAGDMSRVKDCLYLLARLYHTLNLTQERNMAAGQYKKLEDLYPVKTRITMDCLV